MPTITENEIEPCAPRVGPEHTIRDSLARCLRAVNDVIPSGVVIGEGA